ncbi:hypothetical protein CPB83DRAFT_842796 [Crepidotus variabilis]|uniref:CCD97-like C-terminal domain-containing protein n=1 Tax=Crepidotus variabilis TaxID=179855 RepID=A0A9P6ESQ9_9AGAR|nr:hypothetical protein CPB83DRAFT_842796 [Crepidotus variabilis]
MQFEKVPVLKYLGLPQEYAPSPETNPIEFLTLHLLQLPPNILQKFSMITTPKQRTPLVSIRNRRLQYANKCPRELRFEVARNKWPELWQGRERRGVEEGNEERVWAQQSFLAGSRQHIGKLGNLLADYEEEREADRVRTLRRSRMPVDPEDDFVAEEDTDSDEEEINDSPARPVEETDMEAKMWFERRIREKFIYGLLDDIDYDEVDWDESLDGEEDRDAEEKWFDEEED